MHSTPFTAADKSPLYADSSIVTNFFLNYNSISTGKSQFDQRKQKPSRLSPFKRTFVHSKESEKFNDISHYQLRNDNKKRRLCRPQLIHAF